jgi:rod shape-determining protein MreC
MQRERRIANYLFLLYSGAAMAFLSLPLSRPIRSFRTVIEYLWAPVPRGSSEAIERAGEISSDVSHLLHADSENRALREDLKQLSWVEAQLATARRENERMRAALGIRPERGHTVRWARVMERDPATWYRALLVDAGAADGIELNAPVLGLENGRLGAVGRITELGPHWAKVLLLTDELSSIAGYIPGKEWEGLIEGQGKPVLVMSYLPIDAHFAIGDLVHTSATSQTFPPDVLVGSVVQVFPEDPFLTSRSVAVAPAVQAARLKEVLILKAVKEHLSAAGS